MVGFSVPLLTILGTAATTFAAQAADRVCVVEVAKEGADLTETLHRIEGELRAVGFGIERYSAPSARAWVLEERAERCASGTIELEWSADGSVLEVRAFDGTEALPLSQTLPATSPEFSPDWVSVRVVEVFRAALVQRQRGPSGSRSRSPVVRRFTRSEEVPPKAPVPEAHSSGTQRDSLAQTADPDGGWFLLGGPTVRFDGGAPGLSLGLGISRRFDWFFLGGHAEARLLPGSVERDARVVEVSQYSASAEFGLRMFATARFLGILSGGFGARRLEMVAHGEAETVAILAHHTSPFLGVGGLFGVRWSASFGVGLLVGVESLLDAPRITLGTAEFGWGRPSFFVAPRLLATF